jgi:hypothetical protein
MEGRRAVLISVLLTILVGYMLPSAASAHEQREIDAHSFVVGWMIEPVFEGQQNGVDFRVTETSSGNPVEGLAQSIKVEVSYLPTGVSGVFPLRALFGQPGRYTADLLVTASGEYSFRFFGVIAGMEVNEIFNSAGTGGGFNDVQPSSDIQFPERVPEMRELAGVIQTLQGRVDAQDAAGNGITTPLAIAALVVGTIGLVAGGSTFVLGRRIGR